MHVPLGMFSQELCDPLGLLRREVVGDNVNLPAFGFQRNDLAEKGHKLLGGMVGGGLTQDFAAFGVQRSVERKRAILIVLEAVAFGSPRAKRQHRVEAIERLDGGLLIDANTAACCGGSTYSPIKSSALRSKSGSSEAM